VGLKIIGAGFGRTGTYSLKLALEELGLGRCHHMWEVFKNPAQLRAWQRVASGEVPDWDGLFEGYAAQVDWPGAYYWRQLAEHFPQAKVILTVRSEQSWYDSIMSTVYPSSRDHATYSSEQTRARAEFVYQIVSQQSFDGRLEDRDYAISIFRRHIAGVQASVPAHRLLTYRVSDGWKPLCEFLEMPLPSTPFPHSNRREEFLRIRPADV